MQVIPQLKGLEWTFNCRSCNTVLFLSSSILQHKPGQSPAPPADMTWLQSMGASPKTLMPAAQLPRDDDEEGKAPPAPVSSNPPLDASSVTGVRPPLGGAGAMMSSAIPTSFAGGFGGGFYYFGGRGGVAVLVFTSEV